LAICSTFVWKKPFSANSWRAAAAVREQRGRPWPSSRPGTEHDRRGHGRSAQVSEGNDMDHYADDLADLTQHLDLHDAIHIGHSAGGGEVAHYLGRHGESRVAKVVLVSAVTPSVLQTDANPAGVPQAAFEGLQAQLAANRSEFYRAVASGPFYNFDQPGVDPPSRSSRTGGARA
jgi:non-heme chloroperoxidase